MFDKTIFFLPIALSKFSKKRAKRLFGIVFTKKRTQSGKPFLLGTFRTLRITIYENGIYFSGSLSSYKYGHNVNDLNYDEACEVIKEICKIANCSPTDLVALSFEFAFTIEVAMKVARIISRLISYRRKELKKEFRGTKLTSTKIYCSTFADKAYDKALVERKDGHKINRDILKIEATFKKRHFKNKIQTAADLMNPDIIRNVIFAEYVRIWNEILKAPFFDHSKFTKRELYKIYATMNPLYIEDRKYAGKNEAVKKEIQHLKKTMKERGDFSVFQKIEDDFTAKFERLMASKNIHDFPSILLDNKEGIFIDKVQEERNRLQDEENREERRKKLIDY